MAGIFQGSTRRRERIYVKTRKGFVRVAIIAGTGGQKWHILKNRVGNVLNINIKASVSLFGHFHLTIHQDRGQTTWAFPFAYTLNCCSGTSQQESKVVAMVFLKKERNHYSIFQQLVSFQTTASKPYCESQCLLPNIFMTQLSSADIIPVYHLGNSQILTYFGSEWLSRKARATVGMFWGWRGLPIPYQHDIITCAGIPIKGKPEF